MPPITQNALQEALTLLGSLMAHRHREAIHLVVCGGSALIALYLVSRTTKDVDVLVILKDHHLNCARPLPEWLIADAEDVRRELGLPERWLNDGPADPDLFRLGLPEGVAERLHTREFTATFKVSFIDRIDQIHLKLYAAADQGGRHFTDLRQLQPTEGELLTAARWTFTQNPSEGFLEGIDRVFKALGHADLATRL